MVALYKNKIKLAAERYNTALEYSRNANDAPLIISSSIGLARVETIRGNLTFARKLISSALRKANKIKLTNLYADAKLAEAFLEYESGRDDKAEKKALEAAKFFEEIENQYKESYAWSLLADVYTSMNKIEKALSSSVKARDLHKLSSKRTWPTYSDRVAELRNALRLQKKAK